MLEDKEVFVGCDSKTNVSRTTAQQFFWLLNTQVEETGF